jgi:hypothetical protein
MKPDTPVRFNRQFHLVSLLLIIRFGGSEHFKTLLLLFVVVALSASMTTSERQHYDLSGSQKAIAVLDVASLIQH